LGKESRAAQIASVVCLNPKYAPRLRAAFDRYRAQPPSRERSWTCFYLARALGKLRDKSVAPSLLAALNDDPTEASFGYEKPPNVFIHKAMTPFYRAAAAYALGEIGDAQAVPTLLKVVENFDNAMDVRHAAARALEMIGVKADSEDCKRLKAAAAEYPEIATRRALLRACAGAK
jgi:HEAT repeat protein